MTDTTETGKTEVEVTVRGDTVEFVLNRPSKRNALTRAMLRRMAEELKALPSTIRLLVLSSNGPVFCAGMDLKEMELAAAEPDPAPVWNRDAELYRQVVEHLFRLPCPTLCVVQGPAIAGGVGLVLACDLVLASEAARFSLPEPQRGITASMVMPLLRHRIAPGPAGFLALSGLSWSANDAARFGLIHQLASAADLPSAKATLETAIRSGAPLALQATKRQLNDAFAATFQRDLDSAMRLSADARSLPEAREGLQAFLERRPPLWAD